MSVEFFVAGVPQPQGSKTGYVRGKRAVVVDKNPAKLKPWRAAIADDAANVEVRFEGPTSVALRFVFVRPASAAKRMFPSVRPDVDKLARAVLDGLVSGGLLADDSLVVDLRAVKEYGDTPGVHVMVGALLGAGEKGKR